MIKNPFPTKTREQAELVERLTKAQHELLLYLSEAGDGYAACERVCHPNTAAALERRGLLSIEDGDGGFRPWFDCQITPAGRAALQEHPDA